MSIASSGYTETTSTKMLTPVILPPSLFLCIGSATVLPLNYLESMGYLNMGFQV